ncbi:CD151 antigen-like isoform X2 [Branchiostoma floridae x Branchiostoma japonicum]
MGAECCNKDCLKPSVVSYGVVAWLSSGAALGVGIWMLVEKSTYNSLLDSLFYPATIYILIAAGTFGFIFAVFGCAGAMTDSRCMLALFWITSFVAFAALGSTGFLALYYHDNVLRKDINIRQAINESETNKDLMTVIDKLQTELSMLHSSGAAVSAVLLTGTSFQNRAVLKNRLVPVTLLGLMARDVRALWRPGYERTFSVLDGSPWD